MSDALDDIQASGPPPTGSAADYADATLVLFTDAVSTGGCGNAPASVGPFYCPADQHAYIDLSFFQELARRFGAPGDFAGSTSLPTSSGTTCRTCRHQRRGPPGRSRPTRAPANELSVRLELQADCYAGIWGALGPGPGLIEPGDIEEGLGAAAAVGDDALGQRRPGVVDPRLVGVAPALVPSRASTPATRRAATPSASPPTS